MIDREQVHLREIARLDAERLRTRQEVERLLERVESLEQTAQRRLDDLAFYAEQLAAMTKARDEACELLTQIGDRLLLADHQAKLATLRKVGSHD